MEREDDINFGNPPKGHIESVSNPVMPEARQRRDELLDKVTLYAQPIRDRLSAGTIQEKEFNKFIRQATNNGLDSTGLDRNPTVIADFVNKLGVKITEREAEDLRAALLTFRAFEFQKK